MKALSSQTSDNNNFPTKKCDSVFQTLQSREMIATSSFHIPCGCKRGLLSQFVWVQIRPLLLPVPLGARYSDFGTSVSSSVKWRYHPCLIRLLWGSYEALALWLVQRKYLQSIGVYHSLVIFIKVVAEGREHQRVGCGMLGWKLLPPLVLIFQDASDEMGTEGLSALGSHPQVTRYNKVTPWSSSSSPLHPFHYRRRENSKVFSNSTSPLLESSPKPWIRLTRHVLIESIYFSFLNSHHTSSHPLWFNCVDAHSAIWKAPYLTTSLGSLLPALGLGTSQEGFCDSLRLNHMLLPWADLMFFLRLLPLHTHSVVIACFLIIFPVRS